MTFDTFITSIYKLHMNALRINHPLSSVLLGLIEKANLIENHFDDFQSQIELFEIKQKEIIASDEHMKEYRKYMVWKPKRKLLNNNIESMFDFQHKYYSSEIAFNRNINQSETEEEKEKNIKFAFKAYCDLLSTLIYEKISYMIRTQESNFDSRILEKNAFVFEDFYPFAKEDKSFYSNNKEVAKRLDEFLSNPIKIEDQDFNRLKMYEDFEKNQSRYSGKVRLYTLDNLEEPLMDMYKILQAISE